MLAFVKHHSYLQLHDAIASGQEVVQRAFDARTDAATARAFHGMPEEVLKAAWIEWRERAYDLAVEDCQKWLRTCEHLRGCNLAVEYLAEKHALLGVHAMIDGFKNAYQKVHQLCDKVGQPVNLHDGINNYHDS